MLGNLAVHEVEHDPDSAVGNNEVCGKKTGAATVIDTGGSLNTPTGLAVNSKGDIYVRVAGVPVTPLTTR
ncbi:hypothetical protein ACWD3Z_42230 [Streptomyces sp. NPDC002740]